MVKVREKLSPGLIEPLLAKLPRLEVTVWLAESRLIQVTVVPATIVIEAGE